MKTLLYAGLMVSCVQATINLICNGDFQVYSLLANATDSNGFILGYGFQAPNINCWYTANPSTDMQIQTQSYAYHTKNIELSDFISRPYSLCQNVALQIGKNYSFSFDMFKPMRVDSATIYAYMNNILITSATSYDYLISTKLIYNFTASLVNYAICVNGTFVHSSFSRWDWDDYSPLVDNFTLFQVINITNITSNITSNTNTNISNNISSNTINNNNNTTLNISSNTSLISDNSTINNTLVNSTTNINSNTNISTNTSTSNTTINNAITANSTLTNTSTPSTTNTTTNTSPNTNTNTNTTNLNTSTNTSPLFPSNQGINIPTLPSINSSINNYNHTNLPIPINNIPIDSSPITQNIKITLNFQMISDDQNGYVDLIGQQYVVLMIFNFIKDNCAIYIEGEAQRNVIFTYTDLGRVNVRIYLERSYNLKSFYVTMGKQLIQGFTNYQIILIVNGRPIYLYLMTTSQISAVNNIEPYSTTLIGGINKMYTFTKTFFISYFIVNIINFYTLTLFYNFLCLPAQPSFSHNSLEKLAQLFYVRNSLLGSVERIFSNSNFGSGFRFESFVNSAQSEKIEMFYRQYLWFGGMGMTYNFPANNLETITILCLIAVKIAIAKLFFVLFPSCMRKITKRLKNLSEIFLVEFICMSPMMTVSAFTTILSANYDTLNQKINLLLHVALQFVIILSPFLLLLINGVKRKRRSERNSDQDKTQMTIKSIERKTVKTKCPTNFFPCFQYLLNITIPVFVILRNQTAFFNIVTLNFVCLWAIYVRQFRTLKIKQRIFKTLTLSIFTVHHLSFFVMFVFGSLKENSLPMQTTVEICKCLGLAVIFTVIIGGAVQLLYYLFYVLSTIIIKVYKLVKKQNKLNKNRFFGRDNKLSFNQYSLENNRKHIVVYNKYLNYSKFSYITAEPIEKSQAKNKKKIKCDKRIQKEIQPKNKNHSRQKSGRKFRKQQKHPHKAIACLDTNESQLYKTKDLKRYALENTKQKLSSLYSAKNQRFQ